MEIPTLSQPAAARESLAASANGATGSATAVNSDFQTFLEMLTVQMQNQDPLNPADPTEFATQLATFSSVEQQVQTNELLAVLGTEMRAMGVSQLPQWIGKQAIADMPVQFDGSPVTIETTGNPDADRAELVVTDSEGNERQRLPVETDGQEMEWDGVTDSDTTLPDGEYDLSVEYFADGEAVSQGPVFVQARIVEVRNEGRTPILVMDTGQKVLSSAIIGLRADGT